MNEFADLSDDEFAKTYLNPRMHEEFMESEVGVGPSLCVCGRSRCAKDTHVLALHATEPFIPTDLYGS